MASRKGQAAKPAPKPKSKAAPKSKGQKRPPPDYTSQAERKRRQPTCSMASLRNLENEETLEQDFVGLFGQSSDSHYTWGKTHAKPIAAVKKKTGKAPQFTPEQFAALPKPLQLMFGLSAQVTPEPIIPNSPDRSPFLRLPLEVREKIYARSLIFKRPIILQNDWTIVENRIFCKKQNNALIFVCKQINIEATPFLYKNNVFRTILRPPPSNFYHHDTISINPKFLSFFKNVIITCEKENYHLGWFKEACSSIKKLADANVSLDSLTIITFPQEVGMSHTAVCLEANPVTFADFFYFEGQFMTELKKLHCKFLNVVMKKIDLEDMDVNNQWRVLISIDLQDLRAAEIEEGPLVNPETMKVARWRAGAVEHELLGLKNRFEEVFEDDEKAMEDGKCVKLDESVSCDDGMELAANFFGFDGEVD